MAIISQGGWSRQPVGAARAGQLIRTHQQSNPRIMREPGDWVIRPVAGRLMPVMPGRPPWPSRPGTNGNCPVGMRSGKCLLGNKEHFPHMLAPFEETMRRGGVTDGEGGGDGHLDGPAPDEVQRRRKLAGG